jgi:hypothetical protein
VADGSADQTPALVFVMENAAPDFDERAMLGVLRELHREVQKGGLPAGCQSLSILPGMARDGRVAFKLNLSAGAPGQSAWRQATSREREGRALANQIGRFLVQNVTAFRHAHFSQTAAQVGARSGRRIRGLATLHDQAVLDARKSPDGIARGSWPMETWGEAPRPAMRFFAEQDYYEIPFGCLRPVGLDNVLAAGRCLSATPAALASARVIGTALATGWAAGTAAAFQAAGKQLEDAVRTVRAQMCQ